MRRLLCIALLLMPFGLFAAEGQFYFVAKMVVSSDPVPGARHVYLRWDPIEGQLPNDIEKILLKRNDVEIQSWSANEVMSAAEIDALYRGADHQRRKLETITRLNELASDQGDAFSASQFSRYIHELINPALLDTYNPLWAFLGSRTDFNIARARHRAWIDTAPVTADNQTVVRYELVGVTPLPAETEVRLGYVEIDPTTNQQPLGATDLKQIRVSDWRCDLPEGSKDHYTVMLDWTSPGAGVVSDRVASQAYSSGFDIYRSTENLAANETDAPVRDIASLAAAAPSDSRGRPIIAGLEKVNVSLIIDSGATSYDQEWLEARQYHIERLGDVNELPPVPDANIPLEPKWLEARDLLIRAGLKPGDRRAYYVVPRDFTGNYGPTAAEVVEVPLMTRPPAPWNLRTFADQTSSALNGGNDALTFTWDEVNLDNYIKMYQGTRLFCNILEARLTGVLEYVPIGASCATSPRNAVRLDVRDYRIYRFENFDLAGRFMDSDGDGVENSFETPDLDSNGRIDAFERSAGLQCDVTAQPPGAEQHNYLVHSKAGGSVDLGRPSILNPNAEPIARMRDVVPAGNKDTVYWYRIVSEANSPFPVGRLSFMSAPQRGLFPDRTEPPIPRVKVTKPGVKPEGCKVEVTPSDAWSFSDQVTNDPKDAFTVSCGGQQFSVTGAQAGNPNTDQCLQIASACAGQQVSIDITATTRVGDTACDEPVPFDIDNQFCVSGDVSVVPNFIDTQLDALPGDLVPGGAFVDVKPPLPDAGGSYCISVFETIDGTSTRIGSTCEPGGIQYNARPGLFCGYAVAHDENNNISATVQFPCLLSPAQPKPPSPPQILTFNVDNTLARFTFRLPAEQTAIAISRLSHDTGSGGETSSSTNIPVIDNEGGESISASMIVAPLQTNRDTLCLQIMSVGRDDGTGSAAHSDWSSEKCFTRTAAGEDTPTYLPWPAVHGATEGAPLEARAVTNYLQFSPFLAVSLGETSVSFLPPDLGSPLCWITLPAPSGDPIQDFFPFGCFDSGHVRFTTELEPELRFLMYRQSRISGGAASDWVQVSPLIDYVHFDREVIDIGLDEGPITVWTLNDPYIKTSWDLASSDTAEVLFVDQYPFQMGGAAFPGGAAAPAHEWRYQAVYFDSQHRPVQYRVSDWFGGEAP